MRTRINRKQIEFVYNKWAKPSTMVLNLVEVGRDETVINSILIRAEEIPSFLKDIEEFKRFYNLSTIEVKKCQ